MMNSDQLRELADRLSDPASPDDDDLRAAADFLRQCAEQKPVAWRDHVEQRLNSWRQRFVNKSGDQLALDDFMDRQSFDDLIDYVCDEWEGPDAATQPSPSEPMSDERAIEAAAYERAAQECEGIDTLGDRAEGWLGHAARRIRALKGGSHE